MHQRLAVSWTAPAANGAAITDYDVRYRKQNSDDTWPSTWSSHTHAGIGTSTTIGSLTNGTAYQVQVRAANSAGDSGWSDSAEGTPAGTAAERSEHERTDSGGGLRGVLVRPR